MDALNARLKQKLKKLLTFYLDTDKPQYYAVLKQFIDKIHDEYEDEYFELVIHELACALQAYDFRPITMDPIIFPEDIKQQLSDNKILPEFEHADLVYKNMDMDAARFVSTMYDLLIYSINESLEKTYKQKGGKRKTTRNNKKTRGSLKNKASR